MSNIDDGGPAFPTSADNGHSTNQDGMTLRDWFAGQALAGMGTWMPYGGPGDLSVDVAISARAQWAYRQADKMLNARKVSQEK